MVGTKIYVMLTHLIHKDRDCSLVLPSTVQQFLMPLLEWYFHFQLDLQRFVNCYNQLVE